MFYMMMMMMMMIMNVSLFVKCTVSAVTHFEHNEVTDCKLCDLVKKIVSS